MVYVRIELWPKGDKREARLLQELTIANDGTGTVMSGNYVGALSHSTTYKGDGLEDPNDPPKEAVWKRGRVVAFPRRWSPTRLVAKMLAAMGEH